MCHTLTNTHSHAVTYVAYAICENGTRMRIAWPSCMGDSLLLLLLWSCTVCTQTLFVWFGYVSVCVCVEVSERSEMKQIRMMRSTVKRQKNVLYTLAYQLIRSFLRTRKTKSQSAQMSSLAANLNVPISPPVTIISSLKFFLSCDFGVEVGKTGQRNRSMPLRILFK